MLLIQQNLAGGSNATANANILALTPLRALINAPDVNNGRRSKHLKLRYIIDVTTKPSTTALVRASVGRILPSVTTKVNLSVSTVAYPIGVTTTAKSGSLKNTGSGSWVRYKISILVTSPSLTDNITIYIYYPIVMGFRINPISARR